MLEGIAKMKRPHNKKGLTKSSAQWDLWEYFPQFAHIAKPLRDLTAKHSPYGLPWRHEHQVAFELLRDRLCSAHVLRVAQIGKPFCLHTDASGFAEGAILGQLNDDGVKDSKNHNWHSPLCKSEAHKTQSSYATIEREAFDIIWTLNCFENIVFGSHITVFDGPQSFAICS